MSVKQVYTAHHTLAETATFAQDSVSTLTPLQHLLAPSLQTLSESRHSSQRIGDKQLSLRLPGLSQEVIVKC